MEERFKYGNSIIAEFIDLKVHVNGMCDDPTKGVPSPSFSLQFHSNYQWLMIAWVKFRDLKFKLGKHEFEHSEHRSLTGNYLAFHSIEKTWASLVRGIEWYNQTKPMEEALIWWESKSESEQKELNHLIFGKPQSEGTDELTKGDVYKIWDMMIGIPTRASNKE